MLTTQVCCDLRRVFSLATYVAKGVECACTSDSPVVSSHRWRRCGSEKSDSSGGAEVEVELEGAVGT